MKNWMIRMYEAKLLRDQGKKQIEIAATYNVSERTIRNWLKRAENDDVERPDGRSKRKIKLAPFMKQLQALVEQEPHLNCEILMENLKKQGYSGGISRLREEVAKIRTETTRRIALAFETVPGHQAQVRIPALPDHRFRWHLTTDSGRT